MTPKLLEKGSVIGLASPSHIATEEEFLPVFDAIRAMGCIPRPAKQLYANGWGFAATPQERAEALLELATDDSVDMVFFGGGEGADDVILQLDYDAIAKHPKIWLGFSDATSILNAVHHKCGFDVWYGQSPSDLVTPTEYNHQNFLRHIINGNAQEHIKNSRWHILTGGKAQGTLSAGYLDNYTYLANGGWIVPEEEKQYILCLEEHRMFFAVDHVSDEIARLENSPMMRHTAGILFGQYDDTVNEYLLQRLTVLGKKYGIPVAYCEDFGHGTNSAILRIGAKVQLDLTQGGALTYLD